MHLSPRRNHPCVRCGVRTAGGAIAHRRLSCGALGYPRPSAHSLARHGGRAPPSAATPFADGHSPCRASNPQSDRNRYLNDARRRRRPDAALPGVSDPAQASRAAIHARAESDAAVPSAWGLAAWGGHRVRARHVARLDCAADGAWRSIAGARIAGRAPRTGSAARYRRRDDGTAARAAPAEGERTSSPECSSGGRSQRLTSRVPLALRSKARRAALLGQYPSAGSVEASGRHKPSPLTLHLEQHPRGRLVQCGDHEHDTRARR